MSTLKAALRGTALALITAASLIPLRATPAFAAPADLVVVHDEPGVVTVRTSNPAAKTKVAPTLGTPNGMLAYVGDNSASHCSSTTPPCQFNIHKAANRTITPPNGSSGRLTSQGNAFVDVYTCFQCGYRKADYYSTRSNSGWYGTVPWAATSIKHTDVWDIDYVAIGWEFGGTPVGTINLGSGRLSYDNTVSNTWFVAHDVQHVFLGIRGWPGTISRVKYEVHGSYGFGGNYFTTDAYSSVALPES